MMTFKTVDAYIDYHERWESSLALLRNLFLETELEESIKWSIPVYSINNKNVVGLAAFKNHVGLWFFQGVFLSDSDQKLMNAQEGVTKAMRQWRFNSEDEIRENIDTIRLYIQEAIINQHDNLELKSQKKVSLVIPKELEVILMQNSNLKVAFDSFAPYKKREFADYIRDAKRVETKLRRLEKIKPMILNGIGLSDKYRKK